MGNFGNPSIPRAWRAQVLPVANSWYRFGTTRPKQAISSDRTSSGRSGGVSTATTSAPTISDIMASPTATGARVLVGCERRHCIRLRPLGRNLVRVRPVQDVLDGGETSGASGESGIGSVASD